MVTRLVRLVGLGVYSGSGMVEEDSKGLAQSDDAIGDLGDGRGDLARCGTRLGSDQLGHGDEVSKRDSMRGRCPRRGWWWRWEQELRLRPLRSSSFATLGFRNILNIVCDEGW